MFFSFSFRILQYRFSERNTLGPAHKICDLINAHANCSKVKSVIAEEAGHSQRRGGHDANPAGRFFANSSLRQKVGADSNAYGQHRTNKLASRQAEENRLAVLPDFFGYLNFQILPPVEMCLKLSRISL